MLFFDDRLDTPLGEFNTRFTDAEGALLGQYISQYIAIKYYYYN
ncbi:hypothetical protein PROAA_3040002 [Candidatus Propionivibrio aalborgensis]|uniref:Uncharacterized protein n=1 Tax=Candidatus Propionivibrio aalborgensis TaxID=1860101 RepID=A0A1A8XVN5_9RHOO|nr:hypothetical protein PROAA_3040002 [Candidatus Propionivibrio aalborgensis]